MLFDLFSVSQRCVCGIIVGACVEVIPSLAKITYSN